MSVAPRFAPLAQLRRIASGGAASILAGALATNVLRLVSSMTLTRLLDSSAYGVVGIVTAVAFAVAMVTDTGIIVYVLRHERGSDPEFLDEIWTLRLVRGVLLTVLMAVLAYPIALFMAKPFVTTAIMVWGISFTIDGLSSMSAATGIRDKQLWRLSALDIIAAVVTLAVSIALAIVLRSYWAMIAGTLVGQGVRSVLTYVMFGPARRRFVFSRDRSRELWAFSRTIVMSSILTLFVLQVDKLFLARLMPLATFGFYAVAVGLSAAPEAIASQYCARVLFPACARVASDARERLRAVYYDTRRRVSLLYGLAVGALIGGAPALVDILYDDRYGPVTLYLRLLAFRVAMRLPNNMASELMVAIGQQRAQLVGNIFRVVWLGGGIAAAMAWNDAMLLIVALATDEVAALVYFLWRLARERVLVVREELTYVAMVALGAGIGLGVAEFWFVVRPYFS